MQSTYYKLHADPFRLSPDPRFCFPHRTYRKAMTYMRHALLRAEGFIVITGKPGMGKTTLINDLLQELKTDQVKVASLVSTQLAADDLLRLVAYNLDLDPTGMDKATILNRVARFLEEQHQAGRRTLLIVDEAQDVSAEALEELRLLTNIQIMGQQLLQIFLVGQEELREVVSSPALEQLHQRVIAATYLEQLGVAETKEYIKHRLHRAGWKGNPLISNQAYTMIHEFSRGIPRQINQICNRLLLHGSIEEKDRLGLQDIKIVIEELHEEMLLPLGMQEIFDEVAWPDNLPGESFDEITRPQPAVALQTGSVPPAPGRPSGNPAVEDNPTDHRELHAQPRATPPVTPAVQPRGAASDQADDYPVLTEPPATGVMDHEPLVRKRGTWQMLTVIALLACLGLSFVYVAYSDSGNSTDNVLLSWVHPGSRKLHSQLSPSLENDIMAETGQKANTVNLAPLPSAAGREQDIPETLEMDAQPQPELVELQQALEQKGLQVERISDTTLKVNLGSNGMIAAGSARLEGSALPAIEKLAEVLRMHDEPAIQIVGYTNATGAAEDKLQLSQIDATTIADYLVSQGLTGSGIQSEGRGGPDTMLEQSTGDNPDQKHRIGIFIERVQVE